MHSVQEYCRRLPTETLQMVLRKHLDGREKQNDEIAALIYEILQERNVKEEHPGSE